MEKWQEDTQRWLASEQLDSVDAADAAFARVFAALPTAEPAPDFVERAVSAAWQAGVRRRRTVMAGRVAAITVLALGGFLAQAAIGYAGAWLVSRTVALATHSVMSLVGFVASGTEWWSASARVSNSMAAVLATPQAAGTLVAIELTGAAALYALQRLLRNETGFRSEART